uniref:Uncharacterized protein n=1 Tax=Arundo donax TaxID=35708 RepID=A0A0A9GLK9_ARUDO
MLDNLCEQFLSLAGTYFSIFAHGGTNLDARALPIQQCQPLHLE